MRPFPFLLAIVCACVAIPAHAAEPVIVELRDRASVGTALVTIGDVAVVSGGAPAARDRVARLDLAEFKPRDQNLTVGRRSVEYRLQLAGFDAGAVRVTGAERSAVTILRRAVTAEELVAAARAELLKSLAAAPESVSVQLARPIAVKLPEVPANDRVTVTARTHGRPAANGRAQTDVSIAANGEPLLALAVHLEVKSLTQPDAIARTGGVAPAPATPAPTTAAPAVVQPVVPASGAQMASNEVLVRPRQRVSMQVRTGALIVTAVGEAQQEGRLGQSILVQNVDSKKIVTGRVTGPAAVEIDLGGGP